MQGSFTHLLVKLCFVLIDMSKIWIVTKGVMICVHVSGHWRVWIYPNCALKLVMCLG